MSILALAFAAADSHPSAEMTNPSTGLPVSSRRRVELRIESRSRVPMPEETKKWETLDGGNFIRIMHYARWPLHWAELPVILIFPYS